MAEDDLDTQEPKLRGRPGPFYIPDEDEEQRSHRFPRQTTLRVCQVKTCRRHTHYWRILPGPLGLVACETCWGYIQDMKTAVSRALRQKREIPNAQS